MTELKQAKIIRITNPPRPGEDRVIIYYDPIEVGDLFVFENPSGKYTIDTCKRVEGNKVYGRKSTILGYPPTYKVGATHRQIAKKEIKIDGKGCRVDMDDEEIDDIIHSGSYRDWETDRKSVV